ncbi:hypothetical protein CRE_19073 [Caenorhabditis remanei]|uniref:Serpentine Receptor, class H n=1 Tax=Caenorhabditis remanei TaxID=31234 RepID=E3LLL5_CAERE|nr:hypothetical protein CRE_19073 [Caenorhabditis remanei]
MPYCSATDQFTYLDTPEFYTRTLHILSSISIPFHLFGAYCILFKTPQFMSSVQIPLLHFHFWTFMADLMFSVLVSPYVLVPTFTISVHGIFQEIGLNPGILACLIIITIESMLVSLYDHIYHDFSAMCFSINLILENRYMLLINGNLIWRKIRVPWLVLNYLLIPFFSLPIYLNIPVDQEKAKLTVFKIFQTLPCLPSEIRESKLFVVNEKLITINISSICFLFYFVSQGAVFSTRLRYSLRKTGSQLSDKTARLQKKFLKSLLIQIYTPALVIGASLIFLLMEYALGFYSQKANNIAFIYISCYGLVSTIAMLIVHNPYRVFIVNIFRGIINFFGFRSAMRNESIVVVSSVVHNKNRI